MRHRRRRFRRGRIREDKDKKTEMRSLKELRELLEWCFPDPEPQVTRDTDSASRVAKIMSRSSPLVMPMETIATDEEIKIIDEEKGGATR